MGKWRLIRGGWEVATGWLKGNIWHGSNAFSISLHTSSNLREEALVRNRGRTWGKDSDKDRGRDR